MPLGVPLPILEEQATKKIASGPTATAAVVVVVEEEEAEEEEEISQKLLARCVMSLRHGA